MRYILVAITLMLAGCADKSLLVQEKIEPMSSKVEHHEENNSHIYTVQYERSAEANAVLDDVFGEPIVSDTIKYGEVPYIIETTWKHVDMSAYALQLGKRVEIIIVCRTKDFDTAMKQYKRQHPEADSTGKSFFE